MNLKYIDNLHNASNESLIKSIEAIQRILDKNVVNDITSSLLRERQEVYIGELKERGININE